MSKITETLSDLRNKNLSNDELLLAFQKILEEKEFEINSYKEKYDNLNVIIDIIPNTISWINRDLTYFGVNTALAKTCGLRAEEFIGKKVGFHTKENFFLEFAIDLFATKQETIYRELEATIDGVEKTFLVSGTKINGQNQAVVIGVDITEIKNLQGHISFTEKLATLGEMFAGIIHDINNPLMMIDASIKKIKRLENNINEPELIEIVNKIELSSSKISKIVKGIKIFVRQDELLPFSEENLGAIIEDAIIICESKLKENNVKLSCDSEIKNILISCHFTQLYQVFVNLISNSIDAITALNERWIDISLLKNANDEVIIRLTDSGAGIPKDVQEKMFQAFFTTKERGIGSGLWLSLCSKIIESHGGSIRINNDLPHTTMELTFPNKQH